jgi:hypothetical protein
MSNILRILDKKTFKLTEYARVNQPAEAAHDYKITTISRSEQIIIYGLPICFPDIFLTNHNRNIE